LLGAAAFADGKYAQAFPAFGAERTGAPVVAFVRIDDKPIRLRSQVYTPDVVIVQDSTLLDVGVDVLSGLKDDGLVLINSPKTPEELALPTKAKVMTIPATEIALDTIGKPIPNTTLLGAFAAATRLISLKALDEAIRHRFGERGRDINAKAVARAYDFVLSGHEPRTVATRVAAKAKAAVRPFKVDVVQVPATSLATKTGTWRTFRPVFKHERCTGCNICAVYCPEGVVYAQDKKYYVVDYDYCKGCGLCAAECPFDDIEMVREAEAVAEAAAIH
jgi:pyruvate ferredoxin oxidoreductase gamma subunit